MPNPVYSPPGDDPTERVHDMTGMRLSGCALRLLIVAVVLMGIVFGAGIVVQSQAKRVAPTPTIEPTNYPTYTAYPTYTPYPTLRPVQGIPDRRASITPEPSATPAPSSTITPSPTQTPLPPGFLATWTPGGWMLTRFKATHETFTPTLAPTFTAQSSATSTKRF